MIERATEWAELEIKAHPHMLRHACGYALANQGTDTRTLQAYLGHRNISNTVRSLSWHRTASAACGRTEPCKMIAPIWKRR